MDDQPERTCGKILVCITEDWFALSHFKPLLATLSDLSSELVVVTRPSGRRQELEALGCRVVDFDFQRSSLSPVRQVLTVRRLAKLIAAERPDVVHAIAMQVLILAAAAVAVVRVPHVVFHLTGLGFVGISQSRAARVVRPIVLGVIGRALRQTTSWMLVENPDDLAYMVAAGADPGQRHTILGGAGIDADRFPAMPATGNDVPVAAFVGRMIKPKGVEVLVEAQRLVASQGGSIAVSLYGNSDPGNTEAIDPSQLEAWSQEGGVTWHGHVADVSGIWAHADIAVLPAISREGMPRAVLEAAASARPVIVTDVPGCRHFVHDGVEGLVVPAGDAAALASALSRLAADPELRAQMGAAARRRVLAGFTTAHVTQGIRDAYGTLLAMPTANHGRPSLQT